MAATEGLRSECADELGVLDVVWVIIASKIKLFGCWPDVSSEFQVTEHAVRHMVVLLWVRATADRTAQVV